MALCRIKASLGPTGRPHLTTLRLTGLTDDRPVYSDTDDTLQSITLGTGLAFSAPTLSLSHLGLQSLTDPNADRIFFWDDSEGASKWLACGNSIAVTTTTLDTIQDIRTAASPTFAGLTLTAMSGVVKATAGVLAGGGAHADLATVTANQHHNQAHVLDGADHTVSGLTAGHVLKALTATTFGFGVVPGLHDAVTVAGAPLTLSTQAITFNYDTNDFQLSGNNLQIKDGGIAHDSTSGVHQNVNTAGTPQFAGLTLTGQLSHQVSGITTNITIIDNDSTWTQTEAITGGKAASFAARNSGSGAITGSLIGFEGMIIQQGSGLLSYVKGGFFQIQNTHATGAITNAYVLQVANPAFSSTGTIGTIYGLYVNTQAHANVTTPYAIYQAGTTDRVILLGQVGIGVDPSDARLEVQTTTTEGKQAFTLDQNDVDQAFIDFQGTSAADQANNISTVNGDGSVDGPKNKSASAGWTFGGMILVEINGVGGKWMPWYTPQP